ncbi:MAG: TIGR00269 family protein [Candidatus Woesearchaeota archaeon]
MKGKNLKDLPDERFLEFVENKVLNTIIKYSLFSKKEKIAVAVSGGKDSTTLLYILQKLGYNIEAITVDSHIGCYTQKNLENLRETCKKLGINLHEISFRKIFGASLCYLRDSIRSKGNSYKSCTICGVLRRYLLNKKARELKAKKLVLGHNLDDEAQSILMNLMKNRPELNARLGPAVDSVNDELFVPRVKPLYYVTEAEIVRYSKIMGFPVKYCRCPCASDGFRFAIRDFLDLQETKNPGIKENIVRFFLKNQSGLKKMYENQKWSYCSFCGEISSNNICKACELLGIAGKSLKPGKLCLG